MSFFYSSLQLTIFTLVILPTLGFLNPEETVLRYQNTIKPPFGGTSIPHWETGGATIITESGVRLTDGRPNEIGWARNVRHLRANHWEIRMTFVMGSSSAIGTDGMAFWITSKKKLEEGPIYGMSGVWEGLLVVFDTMFHDNRRQRMEPRIYAIYNDGTMNYDGDWETHSIGSCIANFRQMGAAIESVTTLIVYKDGLLQVFYDPPQDNQIIGVSCFSQYIDLDTHLGYYITISATTGKLFPDMQEIQLLETWAEVIESIPFRHARLEENEFVGNNDPSVVNNQNNPPSEDKYPPPEDNLNQPPQDNIPPPQDNNLPPQDNYPPPQDNNLPPQDNIPPPQDNNLPPQDNYPPPQDNNLPPQDNYPPPELNQPPLENPPPDIITPSDDNTVPQPPENLLAPPDLNIPPEETIKEEIKRPDVVVKNIRAGSRPPDPKQQPSEQTPPIQEQQQQPPPTQQQQPPPTQQQQQPPTQQQQQQQKPVEESKRRALSVEKADEIFDRIYELQKKRISSVNSANRKITMLQSKLEQIDNNWKQSASSLESGFSSFQGTEGVGSDTISSMRTTLTSITSISRLMDGLEQKMRWADANTKQLHEAHNRRMEELAVLLEGGGGGWGNWLYLLVVQIILGMVFVWFYKKKKDDMSLGI